MSRKKFIIEYYIKSTMKPLCIAAIAVTILFVIGIGNVYFVGGDYIYGGSESTLTLAITLFITCMCSFKDELHFFLQHGISRRTQFICFALHLVIMSVICTLINLLLSWIFSLGNPVGDYSWTIFPYLYANRTIATGAVSGALLSVIWYIFLFFTCGVLGYFFTNLFYKLNKLGKVLVPVLFVAFLNCLDFLPEFITVNISNFIVRAFIGNGAAPNPLNTIMMFLIISVLLLAVIWAMMRRCRLKK